MTHLLGGRASRGSLDAFVWFVWFVAESDRAEARAGPEWARIAHSRAILEKTA